MNKTCFNGLYRVNSKCLFNVPFNNAKNPLICDEKNIQNCSLLLQKVEIITGDYTKCDEFIGKNTLVYIDPPYRPLTKTANFTSYDKNNFDDNEQKRLKNFIDNQNKKCALMLISNSDPKNTNEKELFFDSLYSEYNIERVLASRIINRNVEKRGLVSELLIKNF